VEKLVKIPSSFFVEKEPFLYLHASEGAVSNSVTNRVAGNGGRGAEKNNSVFTLLWERRSCSLQTATLVYTV
jgi:hypothetical protein